MFSMATIDHVVEATLAEHLVVEKRIRTHLERLLAGFVALVVEGTAVLIGHLVVKAGHTLVRHLPPYVLNYI